MALQRVRRHGDPGEPDLRLHHQRLEHLGHQPDAPLGRAGVHRLVDRFRVHPALEQRPGDAQRPRARVGEPERAGVGEQPHVQRPRRLRRERPLERAREIEHQLRRRRRLRRYEPRPRRQRAAAHVMVDAGHGVRVLDGARQVAQPGQVGDVEHEHHVRRRDLPHRALGTVGAVRQQKVKPLGDRCGVRDHRLEAPSSQEVPQRHLAPHAVAVRIHVRGEGDAAAGDEHRGDFPCRPHAFRGNRDAVGRHAIKIKRNVRVNALGSTACAFR